MESWALGPSLAIVGIQECCVNQRVCKIFLFLYGFSYRMKISKQKNKQKKVKKLNNGIEKYLKVFKCLGNVSGCQERFEGTPVPEK